MNYEEETEPPVRKAGEPMSEDELQDNVSTVIDGCITFVDEELSLERAKATDYFKGKPFGNEKQGRSQVVITEVRDHINGIMPSFMRVFFGPEEVVEFVPTSPEGDATAKAATQAVRYVFNEDNSGFMETRSVFLDGMVRKLGIFKYWWEEGPRVAQRVEAMEKEALDHLAIDDKVNLTRTWENGDGTWGAEWTEPGEGRVRVRALPTEEFIYNPDARDAEGAILLGHRTHLRKGDLIALGIDEKVIDEYGDRDPRLEESPEEIARRQDSADDPNAGEANRKIQYCEVYMHLDANGDDVAELVKVCTIGPGHHIVHEPEPVDHIPFALFCPDPEPHTITGHSWADRLMDLQLIKSSLIRAANDSLALAIFPRTWYVEGQVNANDILNTEIGAPIRTRGQQMVGEFGHSFIGKEAMPILGYFDDVAERRTGQSKGSTMLDMDALQSTEKDAAGAAIASAQGHVELLARVFAEQTFKPLFRGIFKLLKKHQTKPRSVRIRDQWVQMTPQEWQDMDVRVRVALGSMLVEKKLAALDRIIAKQETILTTLGPTNPLVKLGQYYNTLARATELAGFPDASEFFTPVPEDWQPPAQPQDNKPSPEEMVAQLEGQKLQLEQAKASASQQAKERELALREQEMMFNQQLDLRKLEQENAIANAQIEANLQLKLKEMELKYQTTITTAAVQAEIDKAKEDARLEAENAREAARLHLDDAKHQREVATKSQIERERMDREQQQERERMQHETARAHAEKQDKESERDTRKQEAAKPVVVNVHMPKRGKTKVNRDANGKVESVEEAD